MLPITGGTKQTRGLVNTKRRCTSASISEETIASASDYSSEINIEQSVQPCNFSKTLNHSFKKDQENDTGNDTCCVSLSPVEKNINGLVDITLKIKSESFDTDTYLANSDNMYKKSILDDFQKRSQNSNGNGVPKTNPLGLSISGTSPGLQASRSETSQVGNHNRGDKINNNSTVRGSVSDPLSMDQSLMDGSNRLHQGPKDLTLNRKEQVRTSDHTGECSRRKSSEGLGVRPHHPAMSGKVKAVEPYRDPELLKADHQRLQTLHQTVPASPMGPTVPSSSLAVPTPHPMPTFPFMIHPALGALTGAPPNLTQQQQLAMLAQMQMAQQMTLASAAQSQLHLQRLEMLWTQKYPTITVPPGWVLLRYQEELLSDSSTHRQDLTEQNRRTQERERIWREQNEREQQERAERERERITREKKERWVDHRCLLLIIVKLAFL